jgi:peptide methionine sulfoxide reductase MsrB
MLKAAHAAFITAAIALVLVLRASVRTALPAHRVKSPSPIIATMSSNPKSAKAPMQGDESIMAGKSHGTCANAVQDSLRYGCDTELADRICCFNRHYAEHSGYFTSTAFEKSFLAAEGPVQFYDPIDGSLLFTAPVGRSKDDFLKESKAHGWPSFRDDETNWERVRILPNGETVSLAGTHLGHNLPDRKGNRYCINLVSVAGNPV